MGASRSRDLPTALPIERAARDDRADAEFVRLVELQYAPLVRRLTLVLRDAQEAQDVAQSAFLRALEAWHSLDGRDPRPWLHTIALRLAMNEGRRRRRWRAFLDRQRESEAPRKVDPDLWRALASLEPRTRAAILLQTLDGYSLAEIGAMLGCPAGTVGSLISRGRMRLRSELGDER